MLIDPGTMPFNFNEFGVAGDSFKSLLVLKREFGYPVGLAPINLVESWSWLKKRKENKSYEGIYGGFLASLCGMAQFCGASYLIYGVIDRAEQVIPVIAANDKLISEGMAYFGVNPDSKEHPRYKV